MAERLPELTVGVINYNGSATILKTLDSIFASEGVRVRVNMIDDGSSDGSPELVTEHFPQVEIYREPRNSRQVTRLRNKAISIATTKRVLLSDNDIIYDRRCIAELMRHMDESADIATCSARLMYMDDPDRVYAAACQVHFLAVSIGQGRDQLLSDFGERPSTHAGGGNALINRERVLAVGGFDEEYLMGWGEDGELYQRLMLAGYRCLYIPTAHALHEHKAFSKVRDYRLVGQIYNRLQFVLTHYSLATIVLSAPAFLLFEAVQMVFYLANGMFVLYLRAQCQALRRIPTFLQKRQRIQALRRVSDRAVLFSGPIYVGSSTVSENSVSSIMLRLLSGFFDLYWRMIRSFLPPLRAS